MAEENLKNSHIYWNETIYSGRTNGPKKSKGKSESNFYCIPNEFLKIKTWPIKIPAGDKPVLRA